MKVTVVPIVVEVLGTVPITLNHNWIVGIQTEIVCLSLKYSRGPRDRWRVVSWDRVTKESFNIEPGEEGRPTPLR